MLLLLVNTTGMGAGSVYAPPAPEDLTGFITEDGLRQLVAEDGDPLVPEDSTPSSYYLMEDDVSKYLNEAGDGYYQMES